MTVWTSAFLTLVDSRSHRCYREWLISEIPEGWSLPLHCRGMTRGTLVKKFNPAGTYSIKALREAGHRRLLGFLGALFRGGGHDFFISSGRA